MMPSVISPPATFALAAYYGRELGAAEVPRVQALFDANPEYFVAINGRRANPDEAAAEYAKFPAAHLGFTRRWFAGLFDRDHEMIGVAIVVADLCAPRVWHIALFLVATHLHGQGVAHELFLALEAWMHRSGAQWLRLGVVAGHMRAERFWARHGFRQVRDRTGLDTGGQINTVRILAKPLEALDVGDYLARVPRDRPESNLP